MRLNAPNSLNFNIDITGCIYAIAISSAIKR